MEFNLKKGDHIVIVLKNGSSFEGDVKNLSHAGHRLSLKNVIQYPGHVEIEGYRNFERNEIDEIKLMPLSGSLGGVNDINVSNEKPANFVSKRLPSLPLPDACYKEIVDVQNSYTYIKDTTTDFSSAISLLKESTVIGLYGMDCRKGRSERASIIATATANNIFIFDLAVMGDQAFDKGMRDILQSPSIVKVVHDCRLLSDCLYHRHQTCLTNVRDVEAEDIIVVHQERGCIRKHTRPLNYLAELYLGVPSHILDEDCKLESWEKRPLSLHHMKFLATCTSILIPLHNAIQEQYLGRLIKASKIHNEYIRDSDMFVCITEGSKYVLRNQFIDLVKYKDTCRTLMAGKGTRRVE